MKTAPGETKDLWAEKPEVVARLRDLFDLQQRQGFTREFNRSKQR